VIIGTAKDVGNRYKAHPKTVLKWVRAGILPVIRINARCIRFDLDACDRIMGRRTENPGDN